MRHTLAFAALPLFILACACTPPRSVDVPDGCTQNCGGEGEGEGGGEGEGEGPAVTWGALHVVLSWNDTHDLDIRAIKKDGDGVFCGNSLRGTASGLVSSDDDADGCDPALECAFANCPNPPLDQEQIPPEWDGVLGRTAGDPVLTDATLVDPDPETIDVDDLVAGDYLIAVDVFDAGQDTVAHVEVSLDDDDIGTFDVPAPNFEWIEIALLHAPSSSSQDPCLEDLTDGDATDDCG